MNKFLTMDIETFINEGIHIPYCISFYDRLNTFSYYLTDYVSSEQMLTQTIKDLMVKNMIKFIYIT